MDWRDPLRDIRDLSVLAALLRHLQDDDRQHDGAGQDQEEAAQPHREESQQNFIKRQRAGDPQGARAHRHKLASEMKPEQVFTSCWCQAQDNLLVL